MAGFNFNKSGKKDYALQKRMTNEQINLYGIEVDYIKASKVSRDIIFGEHSHLEFSDADSSKIMVRPADMAGYGEGPFFDKLGVGDIKLIDLIVSAVTIDALFPDLDSSKGWNGIIGDVIKLPNGLYLEVTFFEDEVEGNNNLFTDPDAKNVYMFKCRSLVESHNQTEDYTDVDFQTLTNVFNSDLARKQEQDVIASTPDPDTGKPVVEDTDSVFGDLG